MKKYLIYDLFFVLSFCIIINNTQAQSIAINNDGSPPHSSAMLDVQSTFKGFLIPRMTTAQRTAIAFPAQGLQVFDVSTNTLWFYNGSGWIEINVSAGGTNYWSLGSGGSIYNNNPGKVMLGTSDIGPGYMNIKVPINASGLFLSETGTTSADHFSMAIAAGGGTPASRYGIILGNFGNGMLIANQANAPLQFQTNTSEKMRITPAGMVGINTINPTAQLEVQTATGAAGITHTDGTIRLSTLLNSATSAAFGTTSNHPLYFFTNNTFPPAMTISTAGNVGVGGSIANDKLEIFTPDNSYGITHSSSNGISMGTYTGGNVGWLGTKTNHPLYLHSNNGTGFIALLQNGNVGIGTTTPGNRLHVYKAYAGATGFVDAPLIVENSTQCYINILAPDASATGILFGKPQSNISGGIFYNTIPYNPNGFEFRTNGNIPQMVLNNLGNLGVGTVTPAYKLSVKAASNAPVAFIENTGGNGNSDGLSIKAGSSTTGGAYFMYFSRPDGVAIGAVLHYPLNGVSYATTSDKRLKNIIGASQKGLPDLMKINIYDYTFKLDPDKKVQTGFMAQELYDIFPQSVSKPRENNEPAEKNPWMVDYGSVTPLIIRSVQEQQHKIDELSAGLLAEKKSNEGLKKQNANLEGRIVKLEAALASITANKN